MEKPKVILDLEEILKHQFTIVPISNIIEWKRRTVFYCAISNDQVVGISIEEFPLSNFLEHLSNFSYLTHLVLRGVNIKDIGFLGNLTNLIWLDLSSNRSKYISSYNQLNFEPNRREALIKLSLGRNHIENISVLRNLKMLRILNLERNEIRDVSALSFVKKLDFLNLGSNKINNISPLENNTSLSELLAYDNQIEDLSPIFGHFEKSDFQFDFSNNPLSNPPIEIIQQGKEAIKAWLAEQNKTKQVPNQYRKLILTGNTTIGKTSFIRFLKDQIYDENENSTHGVKQYTWKPESSDLEIAIWDFGGQEYYHSTHQLFFSNNALYLLMYDKEHNCNGWLKIKIDYSDKGSVEEDLEHFDYFYWLRNIRSLSDKSKIIMLQNKVENIKDRIFPDNECFDEKLEYKVEDYQATSVLNAYNYYKEHNKFSPEFEALQNLIIRKLKEVKREEIFEYYIQAKEFIETAAKEKPIVSIEEFIEICKPANENIANVITDENGKVTEYTAWKLMCIYFHETGVLLYYPDSPTLKDKIFIRPTFVTDTIYKVLNYQVKENDGRFSFANAVKSLDNNTELAQDIIELMSAPNFKLIFNYPQASDNYIAPQYLPDSFDENLLNFATDEMKFGFVLHFTQFLPKSIITQFLVLYGQYQSDIIWKYGLLFKKHDTKAFLRCDFKEQKITYWSFENENSDLLKYEVFETLRNINQNDKQLKIAIYEDQQAYSLETVLSDYRNEMFSLFREGYENYMQNIKNKNIMKLQEILEQLLLNDKTGEALSLLLEKVKDSDKEIYNTLILLNSRFVSNENDFGKGIVSRDDYKRSKAQVIYSFQQTIERTPESILSIEIEGYNFTKSSSIAEKEKQSNKELLEKLIDKKAFLEKELVLTYDSEKKFALQEQIKELENQINEMKNQ